MRIKQGYVSPSVSDFPFLKCLGLSEYHDVSAPTVFFGCYTPIDMIKIINHKGFKVIRWCGWDAFEFYQWALLNMVHHVTPLTQVAEYLNYHGQNCRLIMPENIEMVINPTPRGSKIYAYIPSSFPEYHGSDIIKCLLMEYEIIYGDGTYSRDQWYGGVGDQYYDDSFIGLMLSPFAGGAGSVVDMGLRGRKCITNVMDMPNAIAWDSVSDIEEAIKKEALKIGETDFELAQQVYNAIDKDYAWLNTNFYE